MPVLAIIGHLLISTGFPNLASDRPSNGSSIPFPCESRGCGCATAELCWKGDCCCFTLEQKLAWADDNGIEPPAHVRPLVDSRRAESEPRRGESCCAEHDSESCCKKREETCCAAKAVPKATFPSRWVIGLFAKKCRGEGATGLFQTQFTTVPDSTAVSPGKPSRIGRSRLRSERSTSVNTLPPTPPPRSL